MPDQLHFEVPRNVTGPGLSRAAVRDRFAPHVSACELDDLRVIVSELTTNALLHGVGEIHLRVLLEDGVLSGEVVDEGSGFERAVDERGIDAIGGNGLRMVAALAGRWGIHEGTSHVWFELARAAEPEPVDPRLGSDQRPGSLDA
ncbi:MAG: ATP-binding protein [Actinomycetota bacterium]|nr:ATP-binding protein [Actinomycetota bacterium]